MVYLIYKTNYDLCNACTRGSGTPQRWSFSVEFEFGLLVIFLVIGPSFNPEVRINKQVCIPVGCVPPTSMATEQNDLRIGVTTLPCPKLRLRAVINSGTSVCKKIVTTVVRTQTQPKKSASNGGKLTTLARWSKMRNCDGDRHQNLLISGDPLSINTDPKTCFTRNVFHTVFLTI